MWDYRGRLKSPPLFTLRRNYNDYTYQENSGDPKNLLGGHPVCENSHDSKTSSTKTDCNIGG